MENLGYILFCRLMTVDAKGKIWRSQTPTSATTIVWEQNLLFCLHRWNQTFLLFAWPSQGVFLLPHIPWIGKGGSILLVLCSTIILLAHLILIFNSVLQQTIWHKSRFNQSKKVIPRSIVNITCGKYSVTKVFAVA